MKQLISPAVDTLIDLALEEDLGRGDLTSAAVFDGDGGPVLGTIVAKEPLVVFGLAIAERVFHRVDGAIAFRNFVSDGERVGERTVLAEVRGSAASVLASERTALNFVQRLSGVATHARRFADAVAGTSARVVDTRKTTPGFRTLQKQAVVAGGCSSHRADLGSGILIKDNHIAAVGGVDAAVARARSRAPHPLRIEVEVTTLSELEEALAIGVDIVLLDNMTLPVIEQAVKMAHERNTLVEVSGGVTLENVAAIARTGADLISAGSITHSAPAVDLSLEIERAP